MKDCCLVFYDCEGYGKISSCRLFSNSESAYRDVDLFYESFPAGLHFIFTISVEDEKICDVIGSYFENLNEQL